jgi:presequence protease
MTAKNFHLKTINQTYHDFRLVKIVPITELQCILRELIHVPTGARVMHIENDDSENLFCLSFQTLPDSSNGVAHILEHTVLCGSEKFPIKDPFFSMNRRSLNTFMNALTGADFTCYPAASQVPKDFYHILEVYLDAVFHPFIKKLSFLQEGHRLEFENPTDPSTPLEFKGIVYNEMKGALSSGSSRLAEAINETLYPSITYGYNSGGDPKVIPQLTYEELKKFHQIYYHPSRCLFFFYGNIPLEKHLDFIAKQTLNQTTYAPPLPPIPLQPRFKQPVYRELTYPIAPHEDLENKTLIAFGWLTCHILEQQEALALNILEIILMDTDASPLKLAFLHSGWCKQAYAFIDLELNEVPWGITLKGCSADRADDLEALMKTTLTTISQQGIPLQQVENAIHQLEFYRSEITGDHSPFGLSLFMRSGLLSQHGAVAEQGLMIHSLFDQIRQANLVDPLYFGHLIKKYFLDNPHFIRIVMRPDPEQGAREIQEEKDYLVELKRSLSPEQVQQLVEQAAELNAFQEQQEEGDIEVLPKVSLEDIPLRTKDYLLTQEKIGHLTVFHHSVFTNDIIYADLVYDLPDLKEEDLPYLRLLTHVLTQIGCNGRSYAENLDYIQGNTGNLSAGISFNLQTTNHFQFTPTFHLRGKALHRKGPKLFSLIHDTVMAPDFSDVKRFKEILLTHFTGMEGRLSQNGLKYAVNLSASALNAASKMANCLYGLDYYWKIKEIVKDLDRQAPFVIARLQKLQQQVMGLANPHLILGCDQATYDEIKTHHFYGLQNLDTKPFDPWKGEFSLDPVVSQGRLIASPVAFIAKVFPTVSYSHPDAPALNIAAFLFDNVTLHNKIREQGGAYGGGAVSNSLSGNFYFYSYRDPNTVVTLQAFEQAILTIAQGNFDESDLEEAKLEMIQGLDNPVSPGSQAEIAYGWWREGRTMELRQKYRTQLLALTRQDIIHTVKTIILKQMSFGTAIIFAGKELLDQTNQELTLAELPTIPIENI